MTRGMVIGRFMPLHGGHAAVIRAAKALVDHLTIVVCWQRDDEAPVVTRLQWMLETFPNVRVVGHETSSPYRASEDADHCATLAAALRQLHPEPVDRLYASDRRHEAIAEALGAQLVLIDPRHEATPFTSAEVRARPFDHWPSLPPAVKPYYARTICLHGPESTGKSTIAPLLARHFATPYVPEYGRTYTEQFGREMGMADLVTIGRTHAALTQALLRQCNGRLILDTDPLMTAVWADMLLGVRDPWFDEFAATADLYLLLDVDTPFVDDGIRFFGDPATRRLFFDLSRAELDRRNLRYTVIGGPIEERFDRALAAIAEAGL